MKTGLEQLVKVQMASEGAYRSMPAELSREMGSLCKVLDRKFAALRDDADATRKKLNALDSAEHAE